MQVIPYNPQTDPMQYLSQALTQGVTGGLAHRQQQQFQKGLSPTLTPMMLMKKALSAGYPLPAAVSLARNHAQSQYYQAAAKTKSETKIGELLREGYSLDQARLIRDISHGLKPRASARKKYENMDDVEKMNFLSTLKQRAEGQYYGVEGGNMEPRQPKLLKWVNAELAKLQTLSGPAEADEPQTQDEFNKKVQGIEDDDKARAYYNKWVGKWR